jgi:hypothetical protein
MDCASSQEDGNATVETNSTAEKAEAVSVDMKWTGMIQPTGQIY